MAAGSAWIAVLSVVWSYRKRSVPAVLSIPATVISTPQPINPVPTMSPPTKHTPVATSSINMNAEAPKCPSGATSCVESGVGDIPDVVVITEQCQAGHLLIDSNPRGCMAFAPCWDTDLQKCKLMFFRWCGNSGQPRSWCFKR